MGRTLQSLSSCSIFRNLGERKQIREDEGTVWNRVISGTDLCVLAKVTCVGEDVKGKLSRVRNFVYLVPLLVLSSKTVPDTCSNNKYYWKESWILPGRQTSNRYLSKNCPRHTHLFACVRHSFQRHIMGTSMKSPLVKILHFQSKKHRFHPAIGELRSHMPWTHHLPRKQTNKQQYHAG